MQETMDSKDSQLTRLLKKQISDYGAENRFLEFKANHQDAERIGRYISALSNGACLERVDHGYLYFGVQDETLEVVGTCFTPTKAKATGNQDLEIYLRQLICPKIESSIDEFLYEGEKRVVVFRVAAACEEPTTFRAVPYIRVQSSLTALGTYTAWMREIYNSRTDWTAQVVQDASIDDLDPDAITMAREGYKKRFPDFADEADAWSDANFLDKANVTREGHVTKAALLLLGKAEKAHKTGHIAQITWKCLHGDEGFGDNFTIPFIKTTTLLYNRIRNYRLKMFPQDRLIPAEVWKYDARSVLEALHNCIAHQDYQRNERIIVGEDKDQLTFTNAGDFYQGSYARYVMGKETPSRYRNPLLMKAMVNLKMIDSQGYGIHKMFKSQRQRYLPMPDYDDTTDAHVVLHLPGTVIDENYSLWLIQRSDLTLGDAILLDRVQRGKQISQEEARHLRERHWIEGRYPHLRIAKQTNQSTRQKGESNENTGERQMKCENLLRQALKEQPSLTKKEITELLWPCLPAQLNDNQKRNKIDNLLRKLRQNGDITNVTRGRLSQWMLVK